jgi:hypothetical protein
MNESVISPKSSNIFTWHFLNSACTYFISSHSNKKLMFVVKQDAMEVIYGNCNLVTSKTEHA